MAGYGSANAAQSNQAKSRARNLTGAWARLPHFSLSPTVLLLQLDGVRDSFRQSKNQSDGMLGDHWPVNLASVSQNDIARDQLRKHQLMDRSSCGVYPAQPLCQAELLGPK